VEALVFGLLASSALVIGGALGSFWKPSSLVTGAMLAFASGTLISALVFELFPEAVRLGGLRASGWGLLAGAAMRSVGRSAGYAIGLWGATAALLTLAVVVGRRALTNAQPSALAFPLAFAGGAVLASLADTLMPEAFERGRPVSALATAAGFYLSFVLAES
jgi:zinc transporter, ZIP family